MPDNNLFGVDFIARCIAGEGLETANKRQWKLQAGPRILLSDNPETQTTTISATGEDITVDDALSTTSENPVQNKIITNELLTKPTCVLPNGNKVNNQKIMQLTKAQYDAIQNKDPNTYYMITDDASDEHYTAGEGIDITNGVISLDVQYGASLEMTINPNTYVLTATLKDQDGGTLGTAQTVDLPLETMVVGGSYDDATKKVILTLQNGTTVEFSVADLVSGLETSAHAASTYLTQNDAANTYATQLAVSSLKTVPAVTSSDDGKILTADYTGGVGSYAWTSPQTFSQQQADWTESDSSAVDYIKNKPTLAAVATSGNYSDLSGKPSLATVATSGDYDDLTNKPTIPAAQVNADWNASTGVAEILNKPTLGTAAAADTTDFATAAQGAKADTAVQPAAIADMATETWVGQQGFLTDADEVPAVTSNDDGKVLTATYSGGTGSYAWATPSGGGGGLQVETDGTNYWITVNGIRLYFASSAPTGNIPTGSYGIGWS